MESNGWIDFFIERSISFAKIPKAKIIIYVSLFLVRHKNWTKGALLNAQNFEVATAHQISACLM